jgi:hypothetical protein
MAASPDGNELWILIKNSTLAKYDTAMFCTGVAPITGGPAFPSSAPATDAPSGGQRAEATASLLTPPVLVVPSPVLTIDPAVITASGLISVSPKDGTLAVSDVATSQVCIFSSATGKLISRLGKRGGYGDGNVTVAASKFFWRPGDALWVTFQDDGTIWVADTGNQRALCVVLGVNL